MGFKDVDWAYSLDLPSGQKVVLAALCHRTDDKTHQTFVGRKSLAEMVGMTDRGISKILASLDEAGIISREERRRKDGYRDTDLITVNTFHVNEVQVNTVHVNDDQVNDVPTSGEPGSDLRGTRFQARDKSLVTQGSPTDHSFENAWANWPKKVERKKSLTAFLKASKIRGEVELLADVIRFGNAYAATTDVQFVPALYVWLNGERWTDTLPQRRPQTGKLTPTERAQQTADAGRRIAGHQITSLEFAPGHTPSDTEWNALLAEPREALRDTTMSPRVVDCGDHRWLVDGTCARCEQKHEHQDLGAA